MAPPVPPTEEGGISSAPSQDTPANSSAAGGNSGGQDNGTRSWERPWSLEEVRKESGNWSLAGDAGLLRMLQESSQRMIARTHEMEKEVDGLVHEAKLTSVRLNNVTNDFIMLANTQFVENRVYDEDVTQEENIGEESKPEQTEKTREQREADLIPKVSEALKFGIDVIDQAFEKLDSNVANSDSEDEDSGYRVDPILEAKDPYVTRTLPFLIGSPMFLQDDNVGLVEDMSDEEPETDHGSISESEDEKKDEDSETEYSDSEDERQKPAADRTKKKVSSDESETQSDEDNVSDDNMFHPAKRKQADSDDDDDDEKNEENEIADEDSEEEKGDGEGTEKDLGRGKGGIDFTSELAARIGASAPKQHLSLLDSDEEREGGDSGAQNIRPPRKESRARREKKDNKQKEKKEKGKQARVDVDEEADLFGQSAQVEEEDGLFGKSGGLFSSSKGLFDDEQEEESGGGLFDDVVKAKSKPTTATVPEQDQKSANRPRTASGKKLPQGAVSIFGGGDSDLFTSSSKQEGTARERKLTVSSIDSTASSKVLAKKSGGGGLFDDEDDDDDLFSTQAAKKPASKEASEKKKPAVTTTDLFNDEDEADDLFGSIATAQAPTAEQAAAAPELGKKPKEKKLPAGAVSMFGGNSNPLVAALKKQQTGSDSEEEERKTSPSNSLWPEEAVVAVTAPKTDRVVKPSPALPNASSLFEDDDDDDLFAPKKARADSKAKGKPAPALVASKSKSKKTEEDAAPVLSAAAAAAGAGVVADVKEGEDLFTDKKPAPAKKESEVQKAGEDKAQSDSLFGKTEEDDDDLFAAVAPPKETGKKKPPGGVSLFGGTDILGGLKKAEDSAAKEEKLPATQSPPPPTTAAKPSPKQKMLSLFDADDEADEGPLFGAALPSKPAAEDKRKDRSKSKGLFDDEDVLFGTPEEAPPVDIFSKSPPAVSAQKPKPVAVAAQSPPPVAPKEAKPVAAAAATSNLFSNVDDDDDLFSTSAQKAPAKTVSVEGATVTESTDTLEEKEVSQKPAAEPTRPKKPVGGVSMFGGLDPLALLKKRKPEEDEADEEKNAEEKEEGHKDKEKIEETKAAEKEEQKKVVAVKEEKPKSDPLFGDDDGDLFGKSKPSAVSKPVTVSKPPPIVAPKAQRPKVELVTPPGLMESPIKSSPAEGLQSPKPPLSPPSDTKPFKKPVGGVSIFGSSGPFAELRKQTTPETQSSDLSPSSEATSEVLPPLPQLLLDGNSNEQESKPFKKPVGGVPIFGSLGPLAELKKRTASQSSDLSPSSEAASEVLPTVPPILLDGNSNEQESKPFKKPVGGVSIFSSPGPLAELKKRTASQSSDLSPSSEAASEMLPPVPPLSPDGNNDEQESKLFKKPVGGVPIFGSLGPFAELKKRTASQSSDLSPSSEATNEVQSPVPPLSPAGDNDEQDSKPLKKPVPFPKLKKQNSDLSPSSETASEVQSPVPPLSPDSVADEEQRRKPVSKADGFLSRTPQAGRVSNLKKSLNVNPAALLPGATPPVSEEEPSAVDFDSPIDLSPLQSAAKDRPKLAQRRPPSRKARLEAALTSNISFEDTSSPDLQPASDEKSSSPPESRDLFGNDDLFDDRSPVKPSVPSSKSIQPADDVFSKGLFANSASKTDSEKEKASEDDLFSSPSAKSKETQLEDDIFGESKSKSSAVEDDLFGKKSSKTRSEAKKISVQASRDEDEDDLFASSGVSKKSSSSKTEASGKPSADKSKSGSGSQLSKQTAVTETDDIFADSSLNKKKEKKEKTPEVGDTFADSNPKTSAPAKKLEESDDIFAADAGPKAEKKKPKKATTKDETLFKDDTDIFADLPAAKPKEPKKKKKGPEKKGIFKDDIDDIFAEPSPAESKAKKERKKETTASSSIAAKAKEVVDDPLNLGGK